MTDKVLYSLIVNGKGTRNSFDYETIQEANKAFYFLFTRFVNKKIVDDNSVIKSKAKVVQLTMLGANVESVPSDDMASFIPNHWFDEDVYEEMVEAAEQYFEKTIK